ncbi:conserved hypothetical protein [Talaromyces stipitatus ATCC 10500]|uniref:Mitochondrial K+-H+ exchange-related-domain-containing protein n=1 Tax=Talaromyces stipitatus (strain ATCC 10500 / CBS 375.48 / QM 6759 / NRRL 1006) TaxID=441959 RepID=B8M2A4_TALSN|nr:uncharacterized protein TSTA_088040 [Talaromyces stipitatus ATCC 10500]EED21568.1 conserved hypothetical protein [Talaromyces stipitatus ATCC 10500]
MRFFLVPISTKRAFIYCRPPKTVNTGYVDRATNKAAEIWANWEKSEKGWKKQLVNYGHVILQRIPYEEWGLKSIPPLNASREIQEAQQKQKMDVMYPKNAIKSEDVFGILRKLGTERQELHRRRMWWCIGIAPLTAPIAIIPLVPNIPFFYLVYRAWSHWRAWSGSKHLIHLLDLNLINPHAFPELENFYATRLSKNGVPAYQEKDNINNSNEHTNKDAETNTSTSKADAPTDERLLLEMKDGKELGEILETPAIAIEVERAVLQVGQKLKLEEEKRKEKKSH